MTMAPTYHGARVPRAWIPLLLALAAGGGCARPVADRLPPPLPEAAVAAAPDPEGVAQAEPGAEPPIVRIREFPSSSTVSVLAWDAAASAYGLRGELSRHRGELVGGHRRGDHRLFVSAMYVNQMGGFRLAVAPPASLLVSSRPSRDDDACQGGYPCSPAHIVSVSIPDSLLRAHRDSLAVRLYPGEGHDWAVTLRPALVDAYLRAVDSVAVALRTR